MATEQALKAQLERVREKHAKLREKIADSKRHLKELEKEASEASEGVTDAMVVHHRAVAARAWDEEHGKVVSAARIAKEKELEARIEREREKKGRAKEKVVDLEKKLRGWDKELGKVAKEITAAQVAHGRAVMAARVHGAGGW